MRWVIILCCLILFIPLGAAQPGIGLSTPVVEELVIESFPFIYQNQFRVYNKGTEERVFVVSVSAPYKDVLDWITVDTSVFTLLPGETRVIQFSIYAESGYYGTYEIAFRPTLLPTQTAAAPDSAMAQLAMSAAYTLTLVVAEEAGPERPPEAEIAPETPRELTKTVEELEETKATTVHPFDKPLLLNIPARTYQYEPTTFAVTFAEGEEPSELGFVLVSPSGKTYSLPSDVTFSFNEEGTWSALIVIGDEIIAGNPMEVEYSLTKDFQHRVLPRYGIFIPVCILIIALYLWGKHR
ncbi:MAG: hypothetical protein HXS41_11695 [Theionarchaea archaeon]|nr:hypothetical protein [Theionarchaea archaeon]MBU7000598.1 hypothetical protein [Theionarchaea archaeon]MBU7021712.1 hypothetical protein [Theionarchaea archaeon]